MGWSSKWDDNKPMQEAKEELIIAIDKADGVDTIIVGIIDDNGLNIIGESVTLEIPIKGAWGSNSVQAIQVGDLAVHKPLGWDDKYNWRVTHVPTLTMFDKAIPVSAWVTYTDEQLIQWCWKVQQAQSSSWNILKEANNTTYESPLYSDAKEVLKEYCLSIKV